MKSLIALLLLAPSFAQATLKIVTTTTDLAALAEAVGGPHVSVTSIAKGTQDVHQIEAKPSFMVKMRDADLVILQGLELEDAWLKPLMQGSRNGKIATGTKGYLELGPQLDPLEIPSGTVSRADGDVHPGGNPHFQLDPVRMGRAAVLIADRLSEMDAGQKTTFAANAKALQTRLEEKAKDWKKRLDRTGVKEVVTYHKDFTYFLDRFGIKGSLQLEPKPGIPPTAGHTLDVIEQMKKRGIRLVLIENHFEDTVSDKLKTAIPDVRVRRVPVSVGGEPSIKTTEELIESLVKTIEDAK